MEMNYYRIWQNTEVKNRWLLGSVLDVNNWAFREPSRIFMEPCKYQVELVSDGIETDFTVTLTYGVPIVSRRFLDVLMGLPDFTVPFTGTVAEPVIILDKPMGDDHFILITETKYDCVDEEKSQFTKYSLDESLQPEKAGQYSGFYKLILDSQRIGGAHIFRLKYFPGALIVSEVVKHRYDRAGLSGANFVLVTNL
jgi:hypothetical protein